MLKRKNGLNISFLGLNIICTLELIIGILGIVYYYMLTDKTNTAVLSFSLLTTIGAGISIIAFIIVLIIVKVKYNDIVSVCKLVFNSRDKKDKEIFYYILIMIIVVILLITFIVLDIL